MRYVRSYPKELPVLRDLLPEIQTPVLIIAGKRDDRSTNRECKLSLERLPNAKLALVDAPHFTWEDGADQYAELVANWWMTAIRQL
jgi:pimeloyl-ACP methyl ester carboxylesterase